jgi:hypothetical protein
MRNTKIKKLTQRRRGAEIGYSEEAGTRFGCHGLYSNRAPPGPSHGLSTTRGTQTKNPRPNPPPEYRERKKHLPFSPHHSFSAALRLCVRSLFVFFVPSWFKTI